MAMTIGDAVRSRPGHWMLTVMAFAHGCDDSAPKLDRIRSGSESNGVEYLLCAAQMVWVAQE